MTKKRRKKNKKNTTPFTANKYRSGRKPIFVPSLNCAKKGAKTKVNQKINSRNIFLIFLIPEIGGRLESIKEKKKRKKRKL